MAFPAPGDAIEQQLDLNQHLIKHPAATFFMRAEGDKPAKGEVHPGDLLIVDRSLLPKDGSLIVAIINGELTITRVHQVTHSDGVEKQYSLALNQFLRKIVAAIAIRFEFFYVYLGPTPCQTVFILSEIFRNQIGSL